MKKILLIQSRRNSTIIALEQNDYRESLGGGVELVAISSLDENFVWTEPGKIVTGYSAVIFGGSGDFDFDGGRADDDEARNISQEIVRRLRPLIEYLLKHDFPTLGVCYGHQIIAEVCGVKVVNDKEQTKIGTFPVILTEEGKNDVLFSNLPDIFMAQYGHKDSLSMIPVGAVVLGNSAQCRASIVRYGTYVYTTQFHPESTAEGMSSKLSKSVGYLPEGVAVESIMKPSLEASTIIPRFVQVVVSSW